jgi:hypothetical protein
MQTFRYSTYLTLRLYAPTDLLCTCNNGSIFTTSDTERFLLKCVDTFQVCLKFVREEGKLQVPLLWLTGLPKLTISVT